MKKDLSDQSSAILLAQIRSSEDQAARYNARECLFKRWRQGIDLGFLIDLLQSEKTSDRLAGAYYVGELGETVEGLNGYVLALADDPLHDCRRAFVIYVCIARLYNRMIAHGLAKCLLDFNLSVRIAVIDWAVTTSEQNLESFFRYVESGAAVEKFRLRDPLVNEFWQEALQRRAIRGLDIIRSLRADKNIDDIMEATSNEDSLIFDRFIFARKRRDRLAAWNGLPEIGDLGEEYDRRGRLKGDLPDFLPADLSLEALRRTSDRMKGSIETRCEDQLFSSKDPDIVAQSSPSPSFH
jgi:hypothetical protein